VIKAAFLDRDGVINRKARQGEYVTRWEEMYILPGVAASITLLNRAGFRVIIASNQRCVAKGLITTAELDQMHEQLCACLAASGATIDSIYYCPHEATPPCSCRKPAPGMLLAAAREHHLDLSNSWMIGDSEIDVAAGRNAGCKTARLMSMAESCSESADVTAQSLPDAIHEILRLESNVG
jgi:D-glycero-D-manno-heptose 1,7-bisphosphate phosphatase